MFPKKYPLPTPPHLISPFIRHFHISHNAPYLPPKVLHKLCFSFLLIIRAVPRKIENYAYAKMWGANKVHYGKRGLYYLLVDQFFNDADNFPVKTFLLILAKSLGIQ